MARETPLDDLISSAAFALTTVLARPQRIVEDDQYLDIDARTTAARRVFVLLTIRRRTRDLRAERLQLMRVV